MHRLVRVWHFIKMLFEIWWPVLKFPTIFFCLVLLIVVIVPFAGNWLFALPVFSPLKLVEKAQTQIVNDSLSLHNLGSWSVNGPVEQWVVVNETSIALLIRGSGGLGPFRNKLVVFNPKTGNLFGRNIRAIRSLATDRDRVYVGDTSRMQVYDIKTGKMVWEYRKPLDTHGGLYIFVEGNRLRVYDQSKSYLMTNVITLDAQTGALLGVEELSEPIPCPQYTYIIAESEKLRYSLHSDKTIIAEDKQTGKEIGSLEVTVPVDKIVASDEILAIYSETVQEITVFAVGKKGQ